MNRFMSLKRGAIVLSLFVLSACGGKAPQQMQHGSATYLEVLIARQSLLQAEIEQAQNRLAEMCGVIDLYIALGGASE